jgi:hypothetical protein
VGGADGGSLTSARSGALPGALFRPEVSTPVSSCPPLSGAICRSRQVSRPWPEEDAAGFQPPLQRGGGPVQIALDVLRGLADCRFDSRLGSTVLTNHSSSWHFTFLSQKGVKGSHQRMVI